MHIRNIWSFWLGSCGTIGHCPRRGPDRCLRSGQQGLLWCRAASGCGPPRAWTFWAGDKGEFSAKTGFNLYYYDENNNKFKMLIIVDIKTLTEQNLKQSCNEKHLKHLN